MNSISKKFAARASLALLEAKIQELEKKTAKPTEKTSKSTRGQQMLLLKHLGLLDPILKLDISNKKKSILLSIQDANGNIFVSDVGNRVRIICPASTCVLGTDEQNKENLNINIYPNPAKDKLNISMKSPEKNGFNIKVYDFTGRLIFTVYSDLNDLTFNCSLWPSGVYNIIVGNNDIFYSNKLVKE
jgi:hypothetical protein